MGMVSKSRNITYVLLDSRLICRIRIVNILLLLLDSIIYVGDIDKIGSSELHIAYRMPCRSNFISLIASGP